MTVTKSSVSRTRAASVNVLVVVCAVALAPRASGPVTGQASTREVFTGFAINMNSGPSPGAVDFTIERWSTDQERGQLGAIVQEFRDRYEATNQLLLTLQKMPKVGAIKTQRNQTWELRYARQSPLPNGGRRIVLATDRPMAFGEALLGIRRTEYPFTVVKMHLDKGDRGEGKILLGTRLVLDGDDLALENYGRQSLQFHQIRRLD
jgi:hypothetical protein